MILLLETQPIVARAKGPRNNKLTKCLERAQSLPNGVPSGPGSVKCACRAARGSKRLGLSAQDISSRLLRVETRTLLVRQFAPTGH